SGAPPALPVRHGAGKKRAHPHSDTWSLRERAGFRVVGMRSLLVHAEVDLLAHGAHGVLLRISLRTPLLPAQGGDRHGLDGRADDVLLGGVVAEAVLLGAVIDLLLQAGDVTEGLIEAGVSGGLVDGRRGVGHGVSSESSRVCCQCWRWLSLRERRRWFRRVWCTCRCRRLRILRR